MKKKEYQVGNATFTRIEEGFLSSLLAGRSASGWVLLTTECYFSIKHQEECLLWILEREYETKERTSSPDQ